MKESERAKLGLKSKIKENLVVVSSSDDMSLKFWAQFGTNYKYQFQNIRTIVRAHNKEIYSLQVIETNQELKQKLTSVKRDDLENIVISQQNGIIKIWDWINSICLNIINSQCQSQRDFEVLYVPQCLICFAATGKNLLHLVDWTYPGGSIISSFDLGENGKDIITIRRIPAKDRVHNDLVAVSFDNNIGTIKIFDQEGKCLQKLCTNNKEWLVCIETMRVLNNYTEQKFKEDIEFAIVAAGDNSIISCFCDAKIVYQIDQAHDCWIRGLSIWEIRDGLTIKNVILSAGESDGLIKLWEGMDGRPLMQIQISESGARWRSLVIHKTNQKSYKYPVIPYIIYGSKNGSLHFYGRIQQKKENSDDFSSQLL